MAPGRGRRLRHITIPMLTPVIFYTIVLSVVAVMQYFLVPARPPGRHR